MKAMFCLVDCNNFYCSCERLFDATIRKKALVVLSNNDGCVIARSNEAKGLGIVMGTPARDLDAWVRSGKLRVFSSNFTLYGDMSARVMGVLQRFSSNLEVYSIDEAFLDFSGMHSMDLAAIANQIVVTVHREIGIPVSVGIGSTKTIAKLANQFAKNSVSARVFWVRTGDELTALLEQTKIKDVWGIGLQHSIRLKNVGAQSALDFVGLPVGWVRRHLSVTGARIQQELQGKSISAVADLDPSKKTICTARSFGKTLRSYQDVREAMANFAAQCAVRLRQDGLCCQSIQLFLQTNPHKKDEPQYMRSVELELSPATNDGGDLVAYATRGLDLIFRLGLPYMKCGVTLKNLLPEQFLQGALGDRTDRMRKKKINQVFDGINRTHGRHQIRLGAQGFADQHRLKASFLSSKFTTRWNEILQIRN